MCSIEKLGILGIRSFSPHTLETIKFTKPLTLIVGHNGAGKTTIVECLKMATTGEVPPTANKGQNFIHDPRLIGANEVKGQIRLIFSTPSGAQVATCRNFQLANTRDKRGVRTSFKALEAVVQLRDAQGNAKSTSNKCVDVNLSISGFMGVSKAVLENVIFCHQEDGNWPLSDMSTLKKKFDELFGSSRFTKALEVINAIKKKYGKEWKEKQHEFNLIQSALSQMKSLEDKVAACESKSKRLIDESSSCRELCEQAAERVKELEEELAEIGAFDQEWTTFDKMRRAAEEKMLSYKSKMTEIYTETKDELLALRESFKVQAQEEEAECHAAQNRLDDAEKELERARLKQQRLQQEGLDLVRAETEHEVAKHTLDSLLKTASTFGTEEKPIPSMEQLRSEQQREAFVKGLVASLEKAEAKRLESARREKNELQRSLDAKEKLLKQLYDEQNCKSGEMKVLIVKAEHSKNREREISKLELGIEELRLKIEKLNKADHGISSENAMEEIMNERMTIESELNEIQSRLARLETQREAANELKLRRQTRDECAERLAAVQVSVLALCAKFENSSFVKELRDRCGTQPNNKWVAFVRRAVTKLRENYEISRGDSQEAHRKHACLENTETALKERYDAMETEIEKLKEEISSAIGSIRVDDFQKKLSEAQEDFEDASREMLVVKNAEEMYKNYYQYSLRKKKCAFCTRHFGNDEEVKAFDSHMKSRIQKLPSQISDAERIASEKKNVLSVFEKMSHKVAKLGEKMTEAASLRSALKSAESNAIDAAEEASRAEVHFQGLEKDLRFAEELRGKLEALNEIEGELLVAEKAVEDLESKTSGNSTPGLKSGKRSRASAARENVVSNLLEELPRLQAVEKEKRERLNELLRDERQEMVRSREANERLETLRAIRQQESSAKARLAELQSTGDSSSAEIEQGLTSLQQSLSDLERRIEKETAQSLKLKKALEETTQSELRAIRANAATQSHLTNLVDDIAKSLKKIQETAKAIKSFEAQRLRLAESVEEEKEANLCYKEAKQYLANQESKIRDRQTLEQNLLENLNLISHKETVDDLTRKLKAKESGKRVDVSGLKNRLSHAKQDLQKYENEKSSKAGELKAVEDWKRSLAQELKHPKFVNLRPRCSDAEVEICTMETLVNDLKRYHSALDRALMVYHTEKMKQINRSLKQLWREIYVGSDIDYIAIRSSTDTEGGDEPVSGARSYNYRVVMVKGSTELEMRGRCSAGQKVLACLAIRLALAESFAVTCGIFTLDEPTTNLDGKNIESLAHALSELIASRRTNTSFQLVLITHDEEFAEYLRRFGSTDVYYQVRKDGDGFSTIRAAKF